MLRRGICLVVAIHVAAAALPLPCLLRAVPAADDLPPANASPACC